MTGEVALSGKSLVKRFGGISAIDGADIEVAAGETCALIGPNGAGKTTLVGLLSGEIEADSGAIHLNGREITRLRTDQRARLGIGRSFQITSIFPDLSVIENVSLAVQIRGGHSFSFVRPVGTMRQVREPAFELLELVGLTDRAADQAGILSHGEHRRLEIALTLATRPKVLLLDEPMAGLGVEDSRQMLAFLQTLKGTYAILLIEHDMDAVFSLADRISVLVYGKVLASGSPDEIRTNRDVRIAYLGDEA
jgi:branched-chain amino acid transport system ATP-binding protein